ncbi:MAG: BolA family protein [Acidiferrobacteraceae bacterium]
MQSERIRALIQKALPAAEVTVDGDGRHFEAVVVSPLFAGQGLVARHQMVYRALGDGMREEIHALSIKAMTPDERESDSSR